jgi:glycogen operon protein
MLPAGDELSRTQGGNNTAYCQDNEVSWIDWDTADGDLLAFVRRLVRLRHDAPVLRQEAFFEGHEIPGTGGTRDVAWFAPGGGQLTTAEWFDTGLQTVGMYLDGRAIRHRDERGRPVVDDSYLVQLHAGPDPVTVHLPGAPWADGYEFVVSTEYATGAPPRPAVVAPGRIEVPARTVWLLRVLRRPA